MSTEHRKKSSAKKLSEYLNGSPKSKDNKFDEIKDCNGMLFNQSKASKHFSYSYNRKQLGKRQP